MALSSEFRPDLTPPKGRKYNSAGDIPELAVQRIVVLHSSGALQAGGVSPRSKAVPLLGNSTPKTRRFMSNVALGHHDSGCQGIDLRTFADASGHLESLHSCLMDKPEMKHVLVPVERMTLMFGRSDSFMLSSVTASGTGGRGPGPPLPDETGLTQADIR